MTWYVDTPRTRFAIRRRQFSDLLSFFDERNRDVYEEFLNHPPGVCGVIDPVDLVDLVGPAPDSSGCGSCGRNTSTKRSQEEERTKTPKRGLYRQGGYEDGYGGFTSSQDGSDGEAHILSDVSTVRLFSGGVSTLVRMPVCMPDTVVITHGLCCGSQFLSAVARFFFPFGRSTCSHCYGKT